MTSRRICVIGDSHVASLKTGWDVIREEFPQFDLVFFAGLAPLFEFLIVDGTALVATDDQLKQHFGRSSGGKTEIAADYDAYILCGLSLAFFQVGHVYHRCRTADLAVRQSIPVVSGNLFRSAMADHFKTLMAIRLLHNLRRISSAPALLIATPLPARAKDVRFRSILEANGDAAEVSARFHQTCYNLARDLSADYLKQPDETRTGEFATRDEFAQSGERLAPGLLDDDMHMNGVYGAIVLRAALERFRAP